MKATFSQQFKTLIKKHLLNYLRNKNYIKQLIGLLIVCGLCFLLNSGGGNGLQYIPIYMPLAIMLFCRGAVMTWVKEKQQKHKEVQTIMGASYKAYFSSWITFFLLNGLILSLIFVVIISLIGVFNNSQLNDVFRMLLLYFILMFATFSFCMSISTFFKDPLLAAQVTTFVQLLGVIFFFFLQIKEFRQSQIALFFAALVPSTCFQLTAMIINRNFNQFDFSFSQKQGFTMLILESFGYFILFMYLEMVVPNQNGTNKHPLFFLKFLYSKKQSNQVQQLLLNSQNTFSNFFQEQINNKQIACSMRNLQKSFGKKKVVNGLGLNLFKKQIFCLLGHNGAGKTTTINMLTGILKPDNGKINICGLDYQTQLDQIRQKIGVCLQTDVLYDKMTVKQHLQFFANLKGYFGQILQKKIDQILDKCCLRTEVLKQAGNLSGGNKRKLCLACSAIGDSQLIFLDQPSSGMDPNTRRTIWGMIQQLKQDGRTIVLTTHHLEQAEALASRIGILAEGQLMILGTCLYIKQKFGIGYNLFISFSDYQQDQVLKLKQQIRNTFTQIVTNFKQDDQIAKNQMKILLPTSQQKNFCQLFQFLEKKKIHFSLKMSSLQDIFIRIGIDQDSVLNNQPIPEIQKITLPEYHSHYNFFTQFQGIFIKKALTVLRSFAVLFSIILPTFFMAMGAFVGMIIKAYSQTQKITLTWVKFYILVYFMNFAYSFNTSSFCSNIVAQRQIKFKYISFVMGMRKIPYWLGTLSFDMIIFWIPILILLVIIGVFPDQESQTYIHKFGFILILFAAFSISFLPFTYLWSHAFKKSTTAARFFPFLVLIVFGIGPQVQLLAYPQIQFLNIILPIFSPLRSLIDGALSKQMIGQQCYDYFIKHNTKIHIVESIWIPIGILLIQGIIFMTLTIILDNAKFRLQDNQTLSQEQLRSQRSEDLIKQQQKIQNSNGTSYPIIVDHLYKKFPNGTIAIKNNSFVVQQGQTFGLLGPNGAGKSTTFNILTAAQPKTQGIVKLLNCQVKRSVMQIFNQVGVCPQFNPIYDNLTVEEHLLFFSRLKGVNKSKINQIIEFYINNLQLKPYQKQKAGTLSGGNKRKLCLCISLIGNPRLLFLDQPSAGVDPISRRYLWNILSASNQQQNRSIILTTHSIHQAQSLCKKIGILIKGQFICIGSPSELKQRYGKGYRINVRCEKIQQFQIIKKQIKQHYSDYTVTQFESQLKLTFQIAKCNFKFSQAFQLFYNKLYMNKIVKQYEIAENSLQQVFIYLSKLQPEPQQRILN